MKNKTVKRAVKAWATTIPNWKGGSLGDVFFYRSEAVAQAKKNVLHKKVIQVTISYQIKAPRGKK